MPERLRVLVYQRPRSDAWLDQVLTLRSEGLVLGREVHTRRERCYRGPEHADRVWAESEAIRADYAAAGTEVLAP